MGWQLVAFDESLVPAIKALNCRLRTGNIEPGFLFCEEPERAAMDKPQMRREQMILLEGEEARGGVLLQEHSFWLSGETITVINVQTPISEGRVNNKYAHAAGIMMSKLRGRNPHLFALGMGSVNRPWPLLLKSLKWQVTPIPFFYRITNARAFLRNIGALQTTRSRRVLSALAANSGLGWAGLQAIRAVRCPAVPPLRSMPVVQWDTWADEVWEQAKGEYSFIGRRKAEDLLSFLPIGERDLVAWRFEDRGSVAGWAAAMVHRVPDSAHFGNMVVGTLLDCLSVPGYETRVAVSASRLMEDLGADMLISNQTHNSWNQALRQCGYFTGPSNYMLGTSPKLTKLMRFETAHVTRADGDGRIHL